MPASLAKTERMTCVSGHYLKKATVMKPPSDLPKLAAPATRALAAAGFTRLGRLARATEAEVLALHGMGPNAMATLRTAMKAKGLAFAKR